MLILTLTFLCFTINISRGLEGISDVAYASQNLAVRNILAEIYENANNDTKTCINEDAFLNFTQKAKKYGYLTEVHEVVTEDFYILTLFRVKNSSCIAFKAKPLLMWHGFVDSADTWIVAGPDTGLGYLAADECYDVWFGNSRGNGYSYKNLNYTNDASNFKYWNFTFDQFGYYDMPAVIDYILEETDNTQLHYVGHSQGTTQFFIMASTRTEYNNKIALSICLAPIAYLGHIMGPAKLLAPFTRVVLDIVGLLHKYDLISRDSIFAAIETMVCQFLPKTVCGTILHIIMGIHPKNYSYKTFQAASGYSPAQTSIFDLAHFGQAVISNKFQKYDYYENNINIYNTTQVPQYNVSAISAPVAFFSGSSDWLATEVDVKRMRDELPNLVHNTILKDWGHQDFTWGKYIPSVLAPKLFKLLSQY